MDKGSSLHRISHNASIIINPSFRSRSSSLTSGNKAIRVPNSNTDFSSTSSQHSSLGTGSSGVANQVGYFSSGTLAPPIQPTPIQSHNQSHAAHSSIKAVKPVLQISALQPTNRTTPRDTSHQSNLKHNLHTKSGILVVLPNKTRLTKPTVETLEEHVSSKALPYHQRIASSLSAATGTHLSASLPTLTFNPRSIIETGIDMGNKSGHPKEVKSSSSNKSGRPKEVKSSSSNKSVRDRWSDFVDAIRGRPPGIT